MANDYSRTQRVADFLRRELAQLIQFEVRDPRVGLVSVTDVDVSRDLSHAKVYVTVVDNDTADEAKEVIDVLNKAQGFLRSAIAKDSNMRTVPRLRFIFDASIGRGQHLSALIHKAIKSDEGRKAVNEDGDTESNQ